MTPSKRRQYHVVVEESSVPLPSENASGEEKLAWLRSQWRLAAIAQFTYSFIDALKLDDPFTTDAFEEALLQGGEPNEFLLKYLIKLIRLITDNRFIYPDNYLNHMKRIFTQKALIQSGPLASFESYADLSLNDRLEAFYVMTEMALVDSDRVRVLCDDDDQEQEHWRVEPIGYDRFGNKYWLFDDNRLFCERPSIQGSKEPANKKSKASKKNDKRKSVIQEIPQEDPSLPRWELVCRTIADWKTFPLKFAEATDKDEKELYTTLTESLQPVIVKELQEEAKRIQKMFLEEIVPAKRSTRLQSKEINRIRYTDADESAEASVSTRPSRQKQEETKELSIAEQRQTRLMEREMRRLKQEEQAYWESRASEEPAVNQKSTEQGIQNEEDTDSWAFLCPCGVVGENVDDGQPMMACDICATWAHIKCIENMYRKFKRPKKNWDVEAYECELCLEKKEQQLALEDSMEVDIVGNDESQDNIQHGTNVDASDTDAVHCPPSSLTKVIHHVLERALEEVCSSLPEESIPQ